MRTFVRGLNVLIGFLASCVLGLVLYGFLHHPVDVARTDATDPEALTHALSEETADDSGLSGNLWQQGLQIANRGDWLQAIEYLEGALEQEPESPERYLILARAYRETSRDSDAAEVLRKGIEITDAEELELPLKAVNATLDLPEDQRTSLNELYVAFDSDDETAFSTALQNWENGQEYINDEGMFVSNPLWVSTESLAWDGTRFWADYTGVGLLFQRGSIFYGEIAEMQPDGMGSCVTVHTWFPDSGAVAYLRMDGNWETSTAVGDVMFRQRCTGTDVTFTEYDMSVTLDGTSDEILVNGDAVLYVVFTGSAEHQFHLMIRNGYLSQSTFEGRTMHCSIHTNCDVQIIADDETFTTMYRNPYPWGRESPYETPWNLLNFTYRYHP